MCTYVPIPFSTVRFFCRFSFFFSWPGIRPHYYITSNNRSIHSLITYRILMDHSQINFIYPFGRGMREFKWQYPANFYLLPTDASLRIINESEFARTRNYNKHKIATMKWSGSRRAKEQGQWDLVNAIHPKRGAIIIADLIQFKKRQSQVTFWVCRWWLSHRKVGEKNKCSEQMMRAVSVAELQSQ